jgi:RNA polymerase sigma factor (sigma-70 family)
MKRGPSQTFVHDLDILYQVGTVGGLTDRELLSRFTTRDSVAAQQAFEAIVHRHGPMVLGVCRRVLRDEHASEDAFQATFLVLALKADTIRNQNSLGPWLHGVAARISRRARVLSRRRGEQPLAPKNLTLCAHAGSEIDAEELRSVLDEEVDRLPAAYRRVVVLFYLEGKTQEETARELGWTKGTVSGRLARAKDLLRARLTRRGFAPSDGLLWMPFLQKNAEAAVPASLARGTVRTAIGVLLSRAETLSASSAVVALARGLLLAMLLGKVKAIAAALLVLVVFATALTQPGARPVTPGQDRPGRTHSALPSHPTEPDKTLGPSDQKLPQHARTRLGTTRLRHESFVTSVAFAPDGRTLASTSWDGTVRFWDTSTGEPASKFPTIREAGGALSVAYSPDGTKLVIGHAMGLVLLWDLVAAKDRFRAKVHTGDVQSVAFAPDGLMFATAGSADPLVRIWDIATGQERRTLAFRLEPTYPGQLAFSPDGKRLAMGATSRTSDGEFICIWELDEAGDPIIIRKAHDGWLASLVFTPDGRLISCGQRFKPVRRPGENVTDVEGIPQIRIWDARSGSQIRELDPGVDRGKCQVALSQDGKTLISSHHNRIQVWDLASGRITRSIGTEVDESFGGIGGIAISPDGKTAATEWNDHVVHLWDLATGNPLFPENAAHDTAIIASISPDGHLAATADERGIIRIWDTARRTLLRRLELGGRGRIWSLRFTPDGRALAAAGEDYERQNGGFRGIACIWDIPGFPLRHHLRLDHRAIGVDFSPDGRRMAVASWNIGDRSRPAVKAGRGTHDNEIDLFDTATGKRLVGLPGHEGRIRAIAFAPDGQTLVSAGEDMTVRFWDLAAGRQTREIPIEGHRFGARHAQAGKPTSIAATTISPDLKTAITSGLYDEQLLVWDLRAGRIRRTFQVETYIEGALTISPDGRLLASAMSPLNADDRDAAIRIWDIPTKREIIRLEAGVNGVGSLAFSADGKTLISGMSDTTALVWDISVAYDALKRPRH